MIMAKSDFFKISILMLCIEAKCAELVIGVACGQASPAMAGPLFLGFNVGLLENALLIPNL